MDWCRGARQKPGEKGGSEPEEEWDRRTFAIKVIPPRGVPQSKERCYSVFFQALRHAIISEALNPTVVNGMVFEGQRIEEVFAIYNPAPTICAPVRRGCPVVNFVRFGFELAGFHENIVLAARSRQRVGFLSERLFRENSAESVGFVYIPQNGLDPLARCS
jgi:hypothetical protein